MYIWQDFPPFHHIFFISPRESALVQECAFSQEYTFSQESEKSALFHTLSFFDEPQDTTKEILIKFDSSPQVKRKSFSNL